MTTYPLYPFGPQEKVPKLTSLKAVETGLGQAVVRLSKPATRDTGAAVLNWDSRKRERYVHPSPIGRSMGASPSIGLPDLDFLRNKGVSIHKRVPIVGRCFSPFLPRYLRPPT
jgi:hypothetical protein